MCVSIYVHVCVYMCMCVYICNKVMYTHTKKSMFKCSQRSTFYREHILKRTDSTEKEHVQVLPALHTYTQTHIHKHTCMNVCIYVCKYTYVHTHTHTHTYPDDRNERRWKKKRKEKTRKNIPGGWSLRMACTSRRSSRKSWTCRGNWAPGLGFRVLGVGFRVYI
jgi:hypothetical protein